VIYNNVANFAADFGNDRISESTPAQFHSIWFSILWFYN
jgi:hypothetical protein